tara:strand:- start:209 stop:568 length:360 start_codon:yes stop_codon:yes gene_type:complete
MKHNNDFRHDLEFGQMSETKFHKMLSQKKVEVKSDKQSMVTGNVFIEFESRGKLSGISTTEADYYAYYIDDEMCITINVEILKVKLKKLYKENKAEVRPGGDKNTSIGLLVKIKDLLHD